MRQITLEELLEAGCHFGHQVTRQNPKARDFVFEARDGIHIIDLAKTKEGLEEAASYVKELAATAGSSIIVVGTKRQAQPVIISQVARVIEAGAGDGFFSITNRWIGGILTNFQEVSKNFEKLHTITKNLENDEEKSKFTKKEIGDWAKEKQKLESFYGGVADMKKTPDALFIVDSHLEDLAVREAKAMNVRTVGIVDTNSDPEVIDHVIPANDDALGSVELIGGYIMEAWIEGRKDLGNKVVKAAAKAEADKVKEDKKAAEKAAPKVEKEPNVKSEKPKAKVKAKK